MMKKRHPKLPKRKTHTSIKAGQVYRTKNDKGEVTFVRVLRYHENPPYVTAVAVTARGKIQTKPIIVGKFTVKRQSHPIYLSWGDGEWKMPPYYELVPPRH
jgi:hypothetical protein